MRKGKRRRGCALNARARRRRMVVEGSALAARPQRRRQQRRRSGGGATMRRFEQRRRSGGGATMRRFETTGALTEWSGSVEKCECRGGSVAPPGRRAEANLPHWLLIGGGRHGRMCRVEGGRVNRRIRSAVDTHVEAESSWNHASTNFRHAYAPRWDAKRASTWGKLYRFWDVVVVVVGIISSGYYYIWETEVSVGSATTRRD